MKSKLQIVLVIGLALMGTSLAMPPSKTTDYLTSVHKEQQANARQERQSRHAHKMQSGRCMTTIGLRAGSNRQFRPQKTYHSMCKSK